MTKFLRRLRGVFWISILLSLIACTPRFDWREMRHPDFGYLALFPAKPVQATRNLTLAGKVYPLTLQAAQVDDALFAVGVIPAVPPADQAAVLATLEQSVLQNIQGQMIQREVNAAGVITLHATGKINTSQAATLHARFGVVRDQVYEVLFVGPLGELLNEASETFISGFEP